MIRLFQENGPLSIFTKDLILFYFYKTFFVYIKNIFSLGLNGTDTVTVVIQEDRNQAPVAIIRLITIYLYMYV